MLLRHVLFISPRIFTSISIIRYQQNLKHVKYSNLSVVNHIFFRRFSNVAPEENYKEIEIASLSEFKAKKCPSIKHVIPKLQELLNLTSTEVKELMKKCPEFKNATCDIIETNFNVCTEAGIPIEILIQYPIILTQSLLKLKIGYLQELDADIELLAPLTIAKIQTLRRMVETMKAEEYKIPHKNRIIYLSKILNVPAPEICEKLIKHTYVLRLRIDRLENVLKVLLDYGVDPRNILNDCWALRYSSEIAEERLQRAIKANVTKVKTWMIRCPDKVFERCINRQIENRNVLGHHSSVEEYLSKRLECSIENAKYLTEKYPAIKRMNILKMKEILDFLYEQGYTPIHVCRVPRIMVHSQETTKLRIQQLKQLGYTQPSLAILCKSKRDFDKILKKYIKRKKNSEQGSNENE